MKFKILIVKETRANETRVGLIPSDVAQLIGLGHEVYLEQDAGVAAGFHDQEYVQAGAVVRQGAKSLSEFSQLFQDINVIARVKRGSHEREADEVQTIHPHTVIIGSLDPYEKGSSHIMDYQNAKSILFSIDQMVLDINDPMNVLASMSRIAGVLAVQDAWSKSHKAAKSALIIGFGVAGQAAYNEALALGLRTTVITNSAAQQEQITNSGGRAVVMNEDNLSVQQQIIAKVIADQDIIITGARRANEVAPVLIPQQTLAQLRAGTVIVDMALSEGGNVEGSEHDATKILADGVIVTNVSGYPKAMPHEASILWSAANLRFIQCLSVGDEIVNQVRC